LPLTVSGVAAGTAAAALSRPQLRVAAAAVTAQTVALHRPQLRGSGAAASGQTGDFQRLGFPATASAVQHATLAGVRPIIVSGMSSAGATVTLAITVNPAHRLTASGAAASSASAVQHGWWHLAAAGTAVATAQAEMRGIKHLRAMGAASSRQAVILSI
jgi:hypothetical protein